MASAWYEGNAHFQKRHYYNRRKLLGMMMRSVSSYYFPHELNILLDGYIGRSENEARILICTLERKGFILQSKGAQIELPSQSKFASYTYVKHTAAITCNFNTHALVNFSTAIVALHEIT